MHLAKDAGFKSVKDLAYLSGVDISTVRRLWIEKPDKFAELVAVAARFKARRAYKAVILKARQEIKDYREGSQ